MEEEKEYLYEIKVTKERVAILIGKKGETKKDIEDLTKTKIDIDSKEGIATVSGKDAILLFTAREIIKAIGRGFNPDIAKLLIKPDYCMEIINLHDFTRTKKDELRLKGRVIGVGGKSRSIIENLSETYLRVYGKTITLIGCVNNVPMTRKAVTMLLEGSNHSTVFKWLEKKRREIKMNDMLATDNIGK